MIPSRLSTRTSEKQTELNLSSAKARLAEARKHASFALQNRRHNPAHSELLFTPPAEITGKEFGRPQRMGFKHFAFVRSVQPSKIDHEANLVSNRSSPNSELFSRLAFSTLNQPGHDLGGNFSRVIAKKEEFMQE